MLADETIARVERAWGAPPVNVYAATEAPGIAMGSLERVGTHVCEESVVVEVVGADGRPAPPGEPGAKVLLTSLVSRTRLEARRPISASRSGRRWSASSRKPG